MQPTPRPVGIQDYMVIVSNRSRAILMTMSITMAAFFTYAFTRPERYRAQNEIEVQVRSEEPLQITLARTTAFVRRFGIMKRRILSTAGLRRVAAAAEIGMNNPRIKIEFLIHNIELMRLEALRDIDRIEEEIGRTPKGNDTSHLEQRKQWAAQRYDQIVRVVDEPEKHLDRLNKMLEGAGGEKIDELLKQIITDGLQAMYDVVRDDAVPQQDPQNRIRTERLKEVWEQAKLQIVQFEAIRQWKREHVLPEGFTEEQLKLLDEKFSEDASELGESIKNMANELDINISSNYIQIVYVSQKNNEAKRVVDELVARFEIENKKLQEEEIGEAVRIYVAEVQDYEKKVSAAREKLIEIGVKYPTEFKLENIPDKIATTTVVNSSENAAVEQLQRLQNQHLDLLLRQTELIHTIEELKNQKKTTPVHVSFTQTHTQNPVRVQLTNQIAQLRKEIAILRADVTEAHPILQDKIRELKALEGTLANVPEFELESEVQHRNPVYEELEGKISIFQGELSGLNKNLELVEKKLTAHYEEMKKLPETIVTIDTVRREYANLVSTLNTYRETLKTAELTKRLELEKNGTRFTVHDKAALPRVPFSPNKPLIVFMGLLIGIMLSVTVVFLLEYIDHSIKDVSDAKRHLELPILGTISQLRLQEQEIRRKKAIDPFADLDLSKPPSEEDKKTFWERFNKMKKR